MDTSEEGQEKIVDSSETKEELAVNGNTKSENEVEMSKDLKNEVEMSKDPKNEVEMSKDSKNEVEMSKDPKNEVEMSKDPKNEVEMSKDPKNEVEMSKDPKNEVEMSKDPKNDNMSVDNSCEQLNDSNKDTSDEINMPNESNKDSGEDLKMDITMPEGSAQNDNNVTEDNSNVTEDNSKVTEDNSKVTEDNSKVTEDNSNVTEDNSKVTEDNSKVTEDNSKVTEDNSNVTEDNSNVTEDNSNVTEDNSNVTEDNSKVTEDNSNVTEDNSKVTEDNSNVTAEVPNENDPSSINNEKVNDIQENVQSEEPAPVSTECTTESIESGVTKMEVDTIENVSESTDGKAAETSLEENKTFKAEEGEEEFKGFPAVTEELQSQEVVKTLQQKEENELQEMEVFVSKPADGILSPGSKRKRKDVEESDLSSHCSSPALSVASQLSVLSFTKRSRTGSPASRGSRKSTIDLSNPKYLVPFEFGWKREVVTRAITSREDGISKDVYYFHPSGKKLRSLREVSEKMTPGLTIENFTFYKEPLGADPQFETIRNARTRGFSPLELTAPKPFTSPAARARLEKASAESAKETPSTDPSPAKDSPKPMPLRNFVKTPKEPAAKPPPAKREKLVLKFNKGTPKIALKKSPAAVNGDRKSPKMVVPKLEGPKPHPNAPSGPKRKITPRKKPLKSQNNNKEEGKGLGKGEGGDLEMGMLPPLWSPTTGSNKSSSNESLSWSHLDEEKSVSEEGRMDPCTIRCTKAMGLIPTLQCSVCLCLYHPECCDMAPTPSYRQLQKYVCKNCQTKANETKSKNLVKHITPAVVTDSPPIVSPKPIHPGLAPSPTTATASGTVRMPQVIRPKLPSGKSVIGGSSPPSTWLPPSNSLFRSPSIPKSHQGKPEETSTPPQGLVNMNNKRYIVVPKSNVISVASTHRHSPAKAETLQTATIITPTPTSTIIHGPPLHSNPFIQPAANASGVVLVPFVPGDNVPLEPTTPQHIVVNPLPGSSATAVSSQPDLPTGSETTDQMPKETESTSKSPSGDGGNNESMQKFMRNICIGYSALLNVFQYLKVQELLRAGRVCRLWRDLASHSSLWRTVRMKNSQVSDWQGFTDSLSRHGTKHLDLRKMLMSVDDAEEMWATFATHISTVKCLERLDMCRCSVDVVTQIMEACPHLLVFNAQMIGVKDQVSNQKLCLESVPQLKNLRELRLKSFFGLYLTGSLESLTDLSATLKTLSLTSIKNLNACDVHYIGLLQNLEALELGECSELPETFPTDVIAKLTNLRRIRLEKGPWNNSTNEMIYQMSKLKNLVQLELINFDVRPGFDKALASCTNIRRLLLIPTYVTQSATTNNIILSGTFKLWRTLTHFVWVITMELLKVTELFVDQCEGKGSRKSGGNSVPVLKPVPQPVVRMQNQKEAPEPPKEETEQTGKNPTPITVIPIDELFQMLTKALPTTRVKLLKIPFQNTWRQSISEGSSHLH